jgi:hypothetical protein
LHEIAELKAEFDMLPYFPATPSKSSSNLPLALEVEAAGPTVPAMKMAWEIVHGRRSSAHKQVKG